MVAITPPVKPMWASKTVWANMLMAIVAVIAVWVPKVAEIVNAEAVTMIFAMINIVLRMVTKDKISFW